MTRRRVFAPVAAFTAVVLVFQPGQVEAQVRYGAVPGSTPSSYGYGINNGLVGPGYQAVYRLNQQAYYAAARGPQTVTDYQSLINAITSLPGWYGPPAAARPHRPIHPRPTMASDELFRDDGTIRWPGATPSDPAAAPARQAAEDAVRVVVQESRKYDHATIRHVVDARNKLAAFAGKTLPALKARNAADADALERFIVELQKTLATLALNY